METEIRLQSIQEQSVQFSTFEQESIENILGLGLIEDKLVKLKEAFLWRLQKRNMKQFLENY